MDESMVILKAANDGFNPYKVMTLVDIAQDLYDTLVPTGTELSEHKLAAGDEHLTYEMVHRMNRPNLQGCLWMMNALGFMKNVQFLKKNLPFSNFNSQTLDDTRDFFCAVFDLAPRKEPSSALATTSSTPSLTPGVLAMLSIMPPDETAKLFSLLGLPSPNERVGQQH